jgi:hypothetical protein
MDAHTPHHDDELSALERRLIDWRPETKGLDADSMLFAAGLAAGRHDHGRLLGSALCGFLAALAVGLGVWGLTERAERMMLASRLGEFDPAPTASPSMPSLDPSEPSYTPAPADYFSLRRSIYQDPNRWLVSAKPEAPPTVWPPLPEPAILTPRQRDNLLDP